MSKTSKILILGSGPSGYTAAIYAARANLQPLLLAGKQPGGQLTTTTEVENYPGFADGITGPEMMETFRRQAERFGTEVVFDVGVEVDLSQRPFVVRSGQGTEYRADALIVSTGASARYLGLESEQALLGRGVSACATCDGFFFRGKRVFVVGGGDSACEEALFLTRFASSVTLLVRRDELRASRIMRDRVLAHPKVDVQWQRNVVEVLGVDEGRLTGLVLEHAGSGARETVAADGLFLGIGHEPNTGLFRGVLDMDEVGYLRTQPGRTATNVPGVFAAGDCQDSYYRQAITAAGSGCMAAIEAERWLEEQVSAAPAEAHHKELQPNQS
jgi:thioredoxin reductase (NADPH)